MKIRSDYSEALQQRHTQSAKTEPTDSTDGFAALLAPTGNQAPSVDGTAVLPLDASRINPLMLSGLSKDNDSGGEALVEHLLSQASDVLDSFDGYADMLAASNNAETGFAKSAWSFLGGLNTEIESLRQSAAKLPAESELAEVVSELELLAATETFKFNRGDYLE